MPTNTNAYNSRVTDEALEKRFRDTFRAQGGAELVDDLYAQGVIVPIVDFTAAATGQQLAENLQTAWDFSTGANQIAGADTQIITNAGFWQIGVTATFDVDGGSAGLRSRVYIDDGSTEKSVWAASFFPTTASTNVGSVTQATFVVFVRSGDSVYAQATSDSVLDIWYRQIATVSGDLINPSGFTSS